VENTLAWLQGMFGVVVAKVPVPLAPYTDAGMLAALADTLSNHAEARIRFAVLDHISSKPALVLPAADMVGTCFRLARAGQFFTCAG
jgi:hypothetical protein